LFLLLKKTVKRSFGMNINRILPHFLTPEINEEGKTGKYEKSFEQILREEQEKLMKLISEEPETIDDIKQLYHLYNHRMIDDSFFDE
jgi:hypothetical protein